MEADMDLYLASAKYIRMCSIMLELPIRTYIAAVRYLRRMELPSSARASSPPAGVPSDRCDVILSTSGVVHALVCLMIAAKATDNARRLRELASVFYATRRMHEGGIDALQPNKAYFSLKEVIIGREQLVLRRLGFDLDTGNPIVLTLNLAYATHRSSAVARLACALLADIAVPRLDEDDRVLAASCVLAAMLLLNEHDQDMLQHSHVVTMGHASRAPLERILHAEKSAPFWKPLEVEDSLVYATTNKILENV